MKLTQKLYLSGGTLLVVGGLSLFVGCGGDSNDTTDAACPTPDLARVDPATVKCGSNTAINATNNTCELTASACQGGTMFDGTAFACKPSDKNYGTKVFSSPFIIAYPNLFTSSTSADAGTSTCGGGTCQALGTLGTISATAPPDATVTYLKFGKEIGKPATGLYPIHWETGNVSDTPSAVDHQTTVGDWKKCGGSYTIYKDPPSGKKNYNVVVDVANCPVGLIFSVWGVVSNDGSFPNRVNAFPLGGVPNSLEIDQKGGGHWEREIDPAIWFKQNALVNGNAHNPALGMGAIPDLTAHPTAGFWVALNIHANGQSNGNAGFCEKDGTTNCAGGPCCVTPASSNIALPGQVGIDQAPILVGPTAGAATATPLSMIQPY